MPFNDSSPLKRELPWWECGAEYITNSLLKRLRELESEKLKLQHEKAALENTLEAEQEYISRKLCKQVREGSTLCMRGGCALLHRHCCSGMWGPVMVSICEARLLGTLQPVIVGLASAAVDFMASPAEA